MTNTANGLRTAATELDNANTEMVKIQNIAAVNMGNQLNQIQEQIRRMENQIQEQIRGMEQRILRQQSRSCVDRVHLFQESNSMLTISSEKNNLARLFNSRVAHETHHLEPLYNMDDELIVDFPLTSADINGLDGE